MTDAIKRKAKSSSEVVSKKQRKNQGKNYLPREIWGIIFSNFDVHQINVFRSVSKEFQGITEGYIEHTLKAFYEKARREQYNGSYEEFGCAFLIIQKILESKECGTPAEKVQNFLQVAEENLSVAKVAFFYPAACRILISKGFHPRVMDIVYMYREEGRELLRITFEKELKRVLNIIGAEDIPQLIELEKVKTKQPSLLDQVYERLPGHYILGIRKIIQEYSGAAETLCNIAQNRSIEEGLCASYYPDFDEITGLMREQPTQEKLDQAWSWILECQNFDLDAPCAVNASLLSPPSSKILSKLAPEIANTIRAHQQSVKVFLNIASSKLLLEKPEEVVVENIEKLVQFGAEPSEAAFQHALQWAENEISEKQKNGEKHEIIKEFHADLKKLGEKVWGEKEWDGKDNTINLYSDCSRRHAPMFV